MSTDHKTRPKTSMQSTTAAIKPQLPMHILCPAQSAHPSSWPVQTMIQTDSLSTTLPGANFNFMSIPFILTSVILMPYIRLHASCIYSPNPRHYSWQHKQLSGGGAFNCPALTQNRPDKRFYTRLSTDTPEGQIRARPQP